MPDLWRAAGSHNRVGGQVRAGENFQIVHRYPAGPVEIRIANDIPARYAAHAEQLDSLALVEIRLMYVIRPAQPTGSTLRYGLGQLGLTTLVGGDAPGFGGAGCNGGCGRWS